jgi:integrase
VIRPRLIGRTPHDFRRTAARNLIRASDPQHVVMQLCGWKTDAMFRRYAIVDERDLREAVARLAGMGAGFGRQKGGDGRRAI